MDLQRIDEIYDDLTTEQRNYVDSILDNMNTITGLFHDKYHRNGGWNGFMDALNDFTTSNNIDMPNFDDLDIDIHELILNSR